MTGSGVERQQRAASRPVRGPRTGVPALLPPASQPAAQRPGRPAGRAGSRFALRTLVVAGFAGVAWLLSGGPAHATDSAPTAEAADGGRVVASLVSGLGIGAVEDAATAPAVTTRPAAGLRVPGLGPLLADPSPLSDAGSVLTDGGSVADVPIAADVRPASLPVDDSATGTGAGTDPAPAGGTGVPDTDATDGGLLGVVRGLVAPLRPTDGPTDSAGPLSPVLRVIEPVSRPVLRTARPAADLLPVAAAPVTDAVGADRPHFQPVKPAQPRVVDAVSTPVGVPADRTPATGSPAVAGGAHLAEVISPAGRWFAGAESVGTGTPPALDGAGAAQQSPGPVGEDADRLPDRPRPAPLRAHLGAGAGLPASASGAPSDGGSSATVPTTVVGIPDAVQPRPVAAEVAARRLDAEAPTVSPD